MRWLPRSLFGRLTLILTGGLLMTALLSVGVLMRDRGQLLYQAIRNDLVQRTAGIVQMLDALPPQERLHLVPLLSTPETHIHLTDQPLEVPASEPESGTVAQLVEQRLREHLPSNELRVSLQDALLPPHASMPWHRRMGRGPFGRGYGRGLGRGLHAMARSFFIQVRLGDGTWVSFERMVPEDLFDWPVRLLATLGILLLGVILVALVVVRWMVRPLRELQQAADALGKDIHRPPLELTGPLEVIDTARAFNRMQDRIKSYVEDKARILAAVSHDLKTPLTRLRLRSELLDDEAMRNAMQHDVDDMEAMVNATLDFMRGSESRERSRPLDLMALLESIRDDVLDAGGLVTLQGTVATPFIARPLALKHCIGNLIENAVRYGGGGEIQVEERIEALHISVRDHGPGIPPEMLEQIFEPFVRLETSRAQHTGGTGLGLGIARNIARAHGGDLTLANHPQGGVIALLNLHR